ncbi:MULTISPECIES: thioester reductase domain-containing protein [Clostridium]|uniref:Thioester reductase domain-containing protein n=1 Tax=Clostridium cibarium TaxID=2762247 RepID=A0ABR8PYX9_9CLOT|nr:MULTISPECIES: thioester reductase domain-containing protein [Clostridium]MBD7913373.1 thioester reductase domain-containing protein [Clostridium cibarium]
MKYYIKEHQENFWKLLKENALRREDEVCFNFYEYTRDEKREVKLTRADLVEKSAAIAATIKERGAKKGDRVVIFSTQTADNILAAVGSMLAGTIFTIIPPPTDSNKMMRFTSVVESCNPKFILCGNELKEEVSEILEKLKKDKKGIEAFQELKIIDVEKCNDNKNFIPEEISLDDIVYIQYSSGSTSAPKGVMISYGNLLSAINSSFEQIELKRLFGWVPFFHNLGLVFLIFTSVVNGGICTGIMSPSAFLEKPSRWFEGLSEFKADSTLAPNSVYESYPKLVPATRLKGIDLSNLKAFLNGSEIVNYSTMKRFADEYKDFGVNIEKFIIGYGLAEATCGVCGNTNYSEDERIDIDLDEYQAGRLVLASDNTKNEIEFIGNGEAIKYVDIKVVNPTTLKECEEDEFGELWVQGPCIAQGYYKNEIATRETFDGKLEGYSGKFLRTGDLGIIKNKKVYVTGRIKELIIINGNNILPNDIVVKLKEKISELNYATIVPFSIVKEDKERLIIVSEMSEKDIKSYDLEEVTNKINACVLEYFEVSPYEVEFVRRGVLPRADNGKISIMKSASLYKECKLELIDLGKKVNSINNNEPIEYGTETEKALGNIINKEFSYKAGSNDNLLNLGMDSLQVLGLTTNIENMFSVSIPISFIFDNPTIEKIGQYIDKVLNGEDVGQLEKDKSYLYDEVKLDESIYAKKYEDTNPPMQNIFITGTTGFVGAYLINTLLTETKAKLYCHVRAKNDEDGLRRLKENMEYYNLWKDEYREYVIPVIGSLDKPLLGIEEERYKYLSEIVDTVYHNGAILNFIYPYERLKDTNVLGTVRTIAFACEGKQKYYNYVSSYSVFDNSCYFEKSVSEDDPLANCTGYYLSYSESKWVAENIIHLARERGLRAAIYRPGEITGANDTGIWKYSDSVSRTIKAMIQTKTYPDVDMKMHMTQVDYIAEAIVNISKQGQAYGKAYNLLNSVHLPIRELGKIINECGYETRPIDYATWKENLFNSGSEHPLKLLESLFKIVKKNASENFESRYGEMAATLQTTNTENALKGTNISCEPMDAEIIKKYLKNFV